MTNPAVKYLRWRLFCYCVSAAVSGLFSIALQFVHDLVQAVAFGLAPTDELFMKSLNADLEVYRHDVLADLMARVRLVEDRADRMEMSEQPGARVLKKRRFPLSMEMFGRAGSTVTAQVQPQVLFKTRKIIAMDTDPNPGSATRIIGIFVGNKTQIGLNLVLPTEEFLYYKCNNEIPMDVCDPALFITIQVQFTRDCEWRATLFGDTVY